ncbi:hypothetical protein BD779DRAFT_1520547 [Infundibulicybe gibba]|nr:hypothetical protein BD779DRAFT_1520547 [Infundibulicybe gibba]
MNSPTNRQFGWMKLWGIISMLFKHILQSRSAVVFNTALKFIRHWCSHSASDQDPRPPFTLASFVPHASVPSETNGPYSSSGLGIGPSPQHVSGHILGSGARICSTLPRQLSITNISLQIPAGFPMLSDTINGLVGVSSRESQRYDRRVKLEKTISPSWLDAYCHPEGALYFHILTDAYLHDPAVLDTVEDYVSQILEFMRKNNLEMPPEVDLVLEPRRSGKYGYYFQPQETRIILVDEYDATDLSDEVRVVSSDSRYHNELYPQSRNISRDDIRQIQDILIHAIGDSLTSLKMLSLTHDIEDHTNHHSPGSACILYRFLGTFAHERFNNLHGQRGAPTKPRGYLLLALDPFFFFAPGLHLQKLEKICIDSFVNLPSWIHLRERLVDEWKEFALYATVLLNANMSFLANRSHSALGLETLSLMYSLPYCLLMWAMLSFLVAFSCMCYSTGDITTYLVVGISWFALVLLIAWYGPYRFPFFGIRTIISRRIGYVMEGKFGRFINIRLGAPNPSQV